MKELEVKIFQKILNSPFNQRNEYTKFLSQSEFLRLKKRHKKDKSSSYQYLFSNGTKEPMLISEKINYLFKNIFKKTKSVKTIDEMETENIRRDYIQKKYFLIYIILTAIISTIITILIGHLFK